MNFEKSRLKIITSLVTAFFIFSQFLIPSVQAEPQAMTRDEIRRPMVSAMAETTPTSAQVIHPVDNFSSDNPIQPLSHPQAANEIIVTTVTRLPHKYEDTNNKNVFYNVKNGKLEIYTQTGPKLYEMRIVNLEGSGIATNSDIQTIQVSEDGKTILVAVNSLISKKPVLYADQVYAIKLESDTTFVKKLITLAPKLQGDVASIKFEDSNIVIATTKKKTFTFDQMNLKEIVAQYQIAIVGGADAKLFEDGTYELTIGDMIYRSEEVGVTDPILHFDDQQHLTTIEQTTWGAISRFSTIWKLENVGGIYRIVEEKGQATSGNHWISTWDYSHATFDFSEWYESKQQTHHVTAYYTSDTQLEDYFQFINGTIEFDYRGSIPTKNRFALANTDKDVYGYKLSEGWRIEVNSTAYYLLQISALDISLESLTALKDRTLAGFKALLKDDQLVLANQFVKTSDGSVYNLDFFNKPSPTKLVFSKTVLDGENVTTQFFDTKTDVQGNITLTIPQPDDTKKIYTVSIDAQGKVSLNLAQTPEEVLRKSFGSGSLAIEKVLINGSDHFYLKVYDPSNLVLLQFEIQKDYQIQNPNQAWTLHAKTGDGESLDFSSDGVYSVKVAIPTDVFSYSSITEYSLRQIGEKVSFFKTKFSIQNSWSSKPEQQTTYIYDGSGQLKETDFVSFFPGSSELVKVHQVANGGTNFSFYNFYTEDEDLRGQLSFNSAVEDLTMNTNAAGIVTLITARTVDRTSLSLNLNTNDDNFGFLQLQPNAGFWVPTSDGGQLHVQEGNPAIAFDSYQFGDKVEKIQIQPEKNPDGSLIVKLINWDYQDAAHGRARTYILKNQNGKWSLDLLTDKTLEVWNDFSFQISLGIVKIRLFKDGSYLIRPGDEYLASNSHGTIVIEDGLTLQFRFDSQGNLETFDYWDAIISTPEEEVNEGIRYRVHLKKGLLNETPPQEVLQAELVERGSIDCETCAYEKWLTFNYDEMSIIEWQEGDGNYTKRFAYSWEDFLPEPSSKGIFQNISVQPFVTIRYEHGEVQEIRVADGKEPDWYYEWIIKGDLDFNFNGVDWKKFGDRTLSNVRKLLKDDLLVSPSASLNIGDDFYLSSYEFNIHGPIFTEVAGISPEWIERSPWGAAKAENGQFIVWNSDVSSDKPGRKQTYRIETQEKNGQLILSAVLIEDRPLAVLSEIIFNGQGESFIFRQYEDGTLLAKKGGMAYIPEGIVYLRDGSRMGFHFSASGDLESIQSWNLTNTGAYPDRSYEVQKDGEETRLILRREPKKGLWHVYQGEKIQTVVDRADWGETIYVHSGVYHEHLVLKQGVNLKGENSENTIIHGDFAANADVIRALGNNLIENLTVTGGGAYNGMPSSAIKIEGRNVTVQNNRISENRNYGIYVLSGGVVSIHDNYFLNNHIGIQLPKNSTEIKANFFNHNDIAINILFAQTPLVDGNLFKDSQFQSIYEYAGGKNPTRGYARVQNNRFINNVEKGSYYGSALPPAVENQTNGNRILHPDSPYTSSQIWPENPGTWHVISPESMAMDHLGNFYVTDSGSTAIKKFSSTGQFIYEIRDYNFLGDTPCFSCYPSHIAVDAQNNFYVTDGVSVKKFSAEGKFLLELKIPVKNFAQPFGAYDAVVDPFGVLYVTDINNLCVHKFSLSGEYLGTIPSNFFSNPPNKRRLGVLVDSQGFVYVADQNYFRVQKFDRDGKLILQWSWGDPAVQEAYDEIFMMDSHDVIYIGHKESGFLKKFDTQGHEIAGNWNDPKWFLDKEVVGDGVVDFEGNIYLSVDRSIVKLNNRGKVIQTFSSYRRDPAQGFFWPVGATMSREGTVYIRDENNHIFIFNSEGRRVNDYALPQGLIPNGLDGSPMAVSAAGELFLSQGNRLVKMDLHGHGTVLTFPELAFIKSMSFDLSGHLWLQSETTLIQIDSTGKTIRSFNLSNAVLASKGFSIQFNDFVFDPEGNIVVSDHDKGIFIFNAQGVLLRNFSFSPHQVLPYGVSSPRDALTRVDSEGNIYVLFVEYGEIQKYDKHGKLLTSWGVIGTQPGQLLRAMFFDIDAQGRVIVVEHGNNRIQVFKQG